VIRKHLFAFLFSFIFCIIPTWLQSQTEEKQPLVLIISNIEKEHNVLFSYANKILEGIVCNTPPKQFSLKEKLDYIEKQVPLKFKILDQRYISIKQNKERHFPPAIQLLDEITVSDYLSQSVLKDINGTIIIEPGKFNILPGLTEPDLLQTIQAIPGVLSINETVSNINVRGGTHDQNLILWDGIKMYQSGHFFGLISAFSPYLTNRVMISKNGTSAIHGDGVSSTIDMQLDQKLNDTISSGAGLNLIHVDAFTKLPINKKLELQLTARRAITDYVESITYEQYFKRVFQDTDIDNDTSDSKMTNTNEAFYFYDIAGKLLYDISNKDKLRFNIITTYNTFNYLENLQNTTNVNSINSGIEQRNFACGLTYNRQWTTNLKSNFQIYTTNYKLNAINFDVINDQRLIQENEVLDVGVKFQTTHTLTKHLTWMNGYQFSEIGVTNLADVNNPVFKSKVTQVLRSHSLFSEATYQSKNRKTNAKAGLRGNYINKFSTFFIEPRLSLNHRIFDHFKLEALAEFKSQTSSQIIDRQNDFLGVEKRRWVVANDSTRPIIKSKQASLGIHYNKNKLLISVEGYLKEVNGITTRNQGFQNQYQFVNATGKYKVNGVDLLINKQFENTTAWLSYSFSKNNYNFKSLNNGADFPNSLNINHAATFAGTHTINDFKFALGINWRSGSPITLPNSETPLLNNRINFEAPNSSNLRNYFRTDFSTTYALKLSNNLNSTIGLSLWNLFDRKNTINTYYVLNEDNSISKVDNNSLGITPNFSFRLRF